MDGVLAADVGGSTIGAGVVTPEGDITLTEEAPTRSGGSDTALDTLLALLERVRTRASARNLELGGCGIGVPGPVDLASGRIGPDIQNLPELAGCPLRDLVAARTGLPTVVDNDVNALTLGEARFGAGRGLRSFVLLALGTGVGGGIYLAGDLVRGASGYGGELGHVTVDVDGRPCFCGSRGCLKAYVSGPDIAAQACEAVPTHPGSDLARRAAGSSGTLTAADVFGAAEAGDPLAGEVVERVCRVLGAALGGIMNGLNPEAIVLTGGVAASLDPHLDRIREHARRYALQGAFAATRVSLVRQTKTTSMRGAAALFFHDAARRG